MNAGDYLKFNAVPHESGFRMDDYWVWCGSVVEEPGHGFHMYAARWPKSYPMFEGYILSSEIVRAWSPTMSGPYRFQEKILPSGEAASWCGRMVHNPTVIRSGSRYLLYFIGSTYAEPAPPPQQVQDNAELIGAIYNRIRIGLAVSDHPTGPWRLLPDPILTPRPGHWDGTVVTNPAPCPVPDGRIFLYYRSNTPSGLRIGLAVAERPEGPYERADDRPVLEGFNVEDPYVWHDGSRFHMLAKDMTGEITGEVHAGAHFTSADGIKWEPARPSRGYSRRITDEAGRLRHLGCLERPQLLFGSDGAPRCLFAAAADGPGGFRQALNTWNIAIPLSL